MSDADRSASDAGAAALVCSGCGRSFPRSERFCSACGMPLVYARGEQDAERPRTERQRRARKIKPQYSEGALVNVARVANQIEAEFIAALLLEEGIPCLLRSSIAGYAPVTGWRDVLVPESGAEAARETLAWDRP